MSELDEGPGGSERASVSAPSAFHDSFARR